MAKIPRTYFLAEKSEIYSDWGMVTNAEECL